MTGDSGDKAKQPPECKPDLWSSNPCPNLVEKSPWNSGLHPAPQNIERIEPWV